MFIGDKMKTKFYTRDGNDFTLIAITTNPYCWFEWTWESKPTEDEINKVKDKFQETLFVFDVPDFTKCPTIDPIEENTHHITQ